MFLASAISQGRPKTISPIQLSHRGLFRSQLRYRDFAEGIRPR
jgi:hypothetical protein